VPNREFLILMLVYVFVGALVLVGWGIVAEVGSHRLLGALAPRESVPDLETRIAECQQRADLVCQEDAWRGWLQVRPDDAMAMGNLGIVLVERKRDGEAVEWMSRAVEAGRMTYDLYASYAETLARLRRYDEAIDWSYRTLAIVPQAMEVRGELATWLMARHRHHEALALLQAYDAAAERLGHAGSFESQRRAIEAEIAQEESPQDLGRAAVGALPSGYTASSALVVTEHGLRLAAYADRFVAPVRLGRLRPRAWTIDPDAPVSTLSDADLSALQAQAGASVRVTQAAVPIRLPGGREARGRAVVLSSIQVGPYRLRDVAAMACEACPARLGRNVLSQFDLSATVLHGVDFLTLTPIDNR
jgi:hypothetical protein